MEGLRQDIRNTLAHVLGEHHNCRSYFCKKQTGDESSSALKDDMNVMNQVQSLLENVACEADRLKHALSTNIAENFMCIIAKYIMGKRENICGRGSYSLRVNIAICVRNEGYAWAKEVYPKFIGSKPSPAYNKLIEKREKQKAYTTKSRGRDCFKKGCTKAFVAENAYGPDVTKNLDMEAEVQQKLQNMKVISYILI